jgi:hypothetical protein
MDCGSLVGGSVELKFDVGLVRYRDYFYAVNPLHSSIFRVDEGAIDDSLSIINGKFVFIATLTFLRLILPIFIFSYR